MTVLSADPFDEWKSYLLGETDGVPLKFCRKGYYVVPPEKPELPQPVDMRWFAEGRRKGAEAFELARTA